MRSRRKGSVRRNRSAPRSLASINTVSHDAPSAAASKTSGFCRGSRSICFAAYPTVIPFFYKPNKALGCNRGFVFLFQ